LTLRELVWMAQGKRAAIVMTATLGMTDASQDEVQNYIETGSLSPTQAGVLPYSPAVMAALAGVDP